METDPPIKRCVLADTFELAITTAKVDGGVRWLLEVLGLLGVFAG